MKIVYRDTDLKRHEINLENAVDFSVGHLTISLTNENLLRVKTEGKIEIFPVASNVVDIN